ncbi:MAG: hypothetical protein ACE5R6_04450 [Candidatus Heimdallarchaeota archaeon]
MAPFTKLSYARKYQRLTELMINIKPTGILSRELAWMEPVLRVPFPG